MPLKLNLVIKSVILEAGHCNSVWEWREELRILVRKKTDIRFLHYNWITHNATRLATTGMDLVIVKAESDDVKAVRFHNSNYVSDLFLR